MVMHKFVPSSILLKRKEFTDISTEGTFTAMINAAKTCAAKVD